MYTPLLIKVYSFVANLECYFCQTDKAIVVLFSFKFVGHLCDFPMFAMGDLQRYLGTVTEEETLNILLEFVPGGSISSLFSSSQQ